MAASQIGIGLKARDIDEEYRAATPLELFYDLIFVVAIAHVAAAFHHDYANNHIGHGVISFFMVSRVATVEPKMIVITLYGRNAHSVTFRPARRKKSHATNGRMEPARVRHFKYQIFLTNSDLSFMAPMPSILQSIS